MRPLTALPGGGGPELLPSLGSGDSVGSLWPDFKLVGGGTTVMVPVRPATAGPRRSRPGAQAGPGGPGRRRILLDKDFLKIRK